MFGFLTILVRVCRESLIFDVTDFEFIKDLALIMFAFIQRVCFRDTEYLFGS